MRPQKTNKLGLWLIVAMWAAGVADAQSLEESVWQKVPAISRQSVESLYIGPRAPAFVLVGTEHSIYRFDPVTHKFFSALSLTGTTKTTHQIYSNPKLSSSIYAAGDAGLFVSLNEGVTWLSVFSQHPCFAVAVDEKAIYVATAQGLYLQNNGERDWSKFTGELSRQTVYHLAQTDGDIFAVTKDAVYRVSGAGKEIAKIFTVSESTSEVSLDDEGQPVESAVIRAVAVSQSGRELYLMTGNDLLMTQDKGQNWARVTTAGLPVSEVNELFVVSPDAMMAATSLGFYEFDGTRWNTDVRGLETNHMLTVDMDANGAIYAGTDRGLYIKGSAPLDLLGKVIHTAADKISIEDATRILSAEPSIGDIQQMAIRYAHVSPKQISSWHRQARAKAFLPSLSVGFARADTELFHWDTGQNPDVLVTGRDYLDWSASVSWDFGDLVWSSDRTSIDSRSKLMSELRQDILDQITRIYFERRRMQLELAMRPDLDAAALLERTVRVEELTALIDGFTGGEFSKRIKIIDKDYPQ